MNNDESIGLLQSLSQAIDKLASFDTKDKNKEGAVGEDELESTLSSTEKQRWKSIAMILRDVLFPKQREKVGRKDITEKDIKDILFTPDFSKKIKTSLAKGLLALALGSLAYLFGLSPFLKFLKFLKLSAAKILKFLREGKIGKLLEALKLKFASLIKIIRESKVGKFLEGIFDSMKSKFASMIKIIRESKVGKFFEGIFDSLSTKISRISKIIEAGKGRLLFMEAFPKVFKFFESFGKIGKLFKSIGKFIPGLNVIIGIAETINGFVSVFTDKMMEGKSMLQKVTTAISFAFLNFFDLLEFIGLDLFKYETIRDRVDAIFKPFREGKWLEGLGQIFNQIVSVVMSIPYKIIGWVVGWFNKDLGNKITEWADKLDWFKWVGAIFKRLGKVFDIVAEPFVWLYEKGKELIENVMGGIKIAFSYIKNIFSSIYEKIKPFVDPILKILFGPFKLAWDGLKKVFSFVTNAFKSIGSTVSKFFSGLKNFFFKLMDGLRWLGEKISSIPLFKRIGQELKEIASESTMDSMPAAIPEIAMDKSGSGDLTGAAEDKFQDIFGEQNKFDESESWKDVFSKEDNRTYDAFSDFSDDLTQINKTTGVNNKIAVDQLREFKILNQKFDMLMQQLTNGKNIITNVVNSNSMNSFPQSTSVFDLRRYHREAD